MYDCVWTGMKNPLLKKPHLEVIGHHSAIFIWSHRPALVMWEGTTHINTSGAGIIRGHLKPGFQKYSASFAVYPPKS